MTASSLIHLAEVMATRNATFIERWERKHVANGSKSGFVGVERMRLRSHRGVGFSTSGKVLSKSFTRRTMMECINTKVSSPGERKALEESITPQFLSYCSSGTIERQLPVLMSGKEVPRGMPQFSKKYCSMALCSSHL